MTIEFDTSPIGIEAAEIVNTKPHPDRYNYEAILYVKDMVVKAFKVMSIDFNADFRTHYAEDIMLQAVFGAGTLSHVINPNKEELRIELTQVGYETPHRATMWFKAILMESSNEAIKSRSNTSSSQEVGDLNQLVNVKLQLREEVLEDIDMASVGGTFVNTTPWRLLRTVIQKNCSELGSGEDEAVLGMTIQDPDNKTVRSQITIKHGTPIVELPDILQFEEGGIYNAGIGAFIRRGMWYVWSLYNTSDVFFCKRTLTLLMAPTDRYRGVERTYVNTDSDLTVVVTGDRNQVDLREPIALSEGNSVRYMDSTRTIQDFLEIDGNKATAIRSDNTSEFIGFERKDGKNKVSLQVSTDNLFAETSRLASRDGSVLMCVWENSAPELLRPDMNIIVKVDKDGLTHEYRGKLLQIHTYIKSAEVGLISKHHLTNTTLAVFLENDISDLTEEA